MSSFKKIFIGVLGVGVLVGFLFIKDRSPVPELPSMSFSEVRDWGYQLQGKGGNPLNLEQLKLLPFDLLVIDYSRTGQERDEFSRKDIQDLKATGKVVLSYLSIGESEEVRFYYENMPLTVVEKENPDWKGNYKVFFWMPAWKKIIMSYLDRILKQGFDGIYLDIVDAYYYFGPKRNGGNGIRDTAARDMIKFIEEISSYGKKRKRGFLVFAQNAPAIYHPDSFDDLTRDNPSRVKIWQDRYFNAIDAIGMEDIFFYGGVTVTPRYNPQKYIFDYLKEFTHRGKRVFSIEYIKKQSDIEKYFKEAKDRGFSPLATDRSLDGSFLKTPLHSYP